MLQAVQASKAVGRPVKLIRSREEDMQHDVYRPNAGGRFRAVLDDAGYPLAIHARVAGQSLFGATRKSWLDQTPEGAWDESMVDGIYNQSYRLPHFLVETVDTPLPIPVYFMRSVGSTAAVFFWESFITELAHRARIDQYGYRRNLLADDPLALRVLDAAAQASGWGTAPPPDTFRGISYNCYIGRGGRFKTYVAEVVELRRVDDRFAIKRVFCAVDPGLVVNPNTLEAQIEGGIGFALTNTLKSKITFSNGGADQSNFFDYPLLRIDEMPEIVPIVAGQRSPAAGIWRGGSGAGGPRPCAGAAARDRSPSRRDAVPGGCLSSGGRSHGRSGAGKVGGRFGPPPRVAPPKCDGAVSGFPLRPAARTPGKACCYNEKNRSIREDTTCRNTSTMSPGRCFLVSDLSTTSSSLWPGQSFASRSAGTCWCTAGARSRAGRQPISVPSWSRDSIRRCRGFGRR